MDAPTLPPGYQLKRRVAEGGMGVVYEAVQTALGRRVALKVLHPAAAAFPQGLARFRREARVLAALEHPHAVRVYDFVDVPQPTLVMEFIEGETADARLEREGPLPLALVAQVADQVLSVLEVVHAQGIVHRDLKPANLMFDATQPAPFVRVLDFGIALQDGPTDTRLTQAGSTPGTAAYMSPEQASGEPLDARSDQYALACVLFELLTGRAPFDSANPAHVLSAHLFREPPTLEERGVTGVPPGFQQALRRALAKRPEQRFHDAAELRAALTEGLRAGPRGDKQRAPAPPRPLFVAAEVDDPHVLLQLDGASPEEKELVATALAAVGVATSTQAGDLHPRLVVAWPAAGAEPLRAVAPLLAAGGPLVLLCGPGDELGLMARAIEAGVYDFVALPLDAASLGGQVVRALRSLRRSA